MTTPVLHDLINKGVIERKPRGEYDLDECREAYIHHLRDRAAGRVKVNGAGSSLTDQRARLAKEQADAKEMENEVLRGKLVQIEDVAASLENQLDRVRTKLLAIPSKVAPEAHAAPDPKEARDIIENTIVDALNELVGFDSTKAGEGT